MRSIKTFILQVAVSSLWPIYVGLMAVAARVGPWPRDIARPAAFALGILALALFAAALARFLFGPCGWAEEVLHAPPAAARQARRGAWWLTAGVIALLLPAWLLQRGLIAHGDRPVTAPALCRMLSLGYEALVFVVAFRLTRGKAKLMLWLTTDEGGSPPITRHRRALRLTLLALIGGVITLEVQGFSFTARRVSSATIQAAALAGIGFLIYKLATRAIDQHAWRWMRWGVSHAGSAAPGIPTSADDFAPKLKALVAIVIPILCVFAGLWAWNIDLALFRSIADQPIMPHAPAGVTVGDVLKALAISTVTFVVWKHLGAFFAVAVFPRMADDPGVRFAVLTLCRYAVLGIGLTASLSSIHMGPERIGFGIAALGVGLGFGLQEIVSNFVSGIILLLERPIRVGDIVTVSGMSGKVERINIRATTIINADNQSLIVPNREFITANLVNWTHKDRIIRASIAINVGYGADPDRVSDLLLTLARNDADVLRNPVPVAILDGFGEWGMNFSLHVHVPDPSLSGRVKHRLCGAIQKAFRDAGISIPLPMREVHLRGLPGEHDPFVRPDTIRFDAPEPLLHPSKPTIQHVPEPCEPSHRGVDE